MCAFKLPFDNFASYYCDMSMCRQRSLRMSMAFLHLKHRMGVLGCQHEADRLIGEVATEDFSYDNN